MVVCCLVGDFSLDLICGHLGFAGKMCFSGLLGAKPGMDIN